MLVSELPRAAPFTTPVPQPEHPNDVAFGGESVVGSPRARAAAVFIASTHLRNNWKLALSTSSKNYLQLPSDPITEPGNGNGTYIPF